MHEINRIIKSKERASFTHVAFCLLLVAIWVVNTLVPFVEEITRRLTIISSFSNLFFPATVLILLIFSIPYIIRNIRPGDIIVYLVAVSYVLVTLLLLKRNAFYIESSIIQIIFFAFPMVFIGLNLNQKLCEKYLFWASLLSVIAVFAYQFYYVYTGRDLSQDNLNTAYNILPSVLYLMYWAIAKRKLVNWLFATLGMILILALGTRGAVVAALVYLSIELFVRVFTSKSTLSKILFISICILIVLFYMSDYMTIFVEKLKVLFQSKGLSTRIFDYFLEEKLTYASGRDTINEIVLNAIKERPILGYGLMGDRVVLNAGQGMYAHNIFTEIWCDFGVIVGTTIMILLFSVIFIGYRKAESKQDKSLIILLFSYVFIKLFFSGSFIVEPYLFLLIGFVISIIRKNKRIKQ